MPPQIRQDAVETDSLLVGAASEADVSILAAATAKSESLNLQGHEVCIDGVVYDLRGFDHPGGGTIGLFGGNDVSVQYRMIHPHHTQSYQASKASSKEGSGVKAGLDENLHGFLQKKMKVVRVIDDYENE
jgi:hypothetical protein